MILKFKQNNSWRFIDNIDECTKAINELTEDGKMEGYEFSFHRPNELLTIFITDSAYLLNNEGKTIECLHL